MNSKPDIEWHAPLPEKIPPPTLWPITLALGACLLAWGIITAWPVLVAGAALFIRGAAGWVSDLRGN